MMGGERDKINVRQSFGINLLVVLVFGGVIGNSIYRTGGGVIGNRRAVGSFEGVGFVFGCGGVCFF